MEEMLDKLDARIKDLEKLGFVHTRVGLKNDTLVQSFLYHQIEEPSEQEWTEYLAELNTKATTQA